jgi:hypothetical protein
LEDAWRFVTFRWLESYPDGVGFRQVDLALAHPLFVKADVEVALFVRILMD